MKGLIIKDFMCLRRQQSVMFLYTIIVTIILSVMFVLSSNHGNISHVMDGLMADSSFTASDVEHVVVDEIIVFMLLPFALVLDVSSIILADNKAGFSKVAACLPVTLSQRVLARFMSIGLLSVIGMAIDLIMVILLSVFTDIAGFMTLLGIMVSLACLMLILSFLTIMFSFLLGSGKEEYAQLASVFTIIVVVLLFNIKSIVSIFKSSSPDVTSYIKSLNSVTDFLADKSYVMLIAMLVVCGFCYLGSVKIAENKRGII
ncbi:MAG: ABC-2 transporter permease [Clostridia bacterium]|nr:ABC-2 transporter permease [Clostridia bacterium]